jgi:hypothetical protein
MSAKGDAAIPICAAFQQSKKTHKTGLGGFEPPTSGLEARRYVQAKPQAHVTPLSFAFRHNICFLNR